MPVDRIPVSWSQFCGLLELDPARLIAVEVNRRTRVIQMVMEPEEKDEDDDGTDLWGV